MLIVTLKQLIVESGTVSNSAIAQKAIMAVVPIIMPIMMTIMMTLEAMVAESWLKLVRYGLGC